MIVRPRNEREPELPREGSNFRLLSIQLRESPRCVHDLVDALGVTQPLISQHLRVLKFAGVVHGDRHGREVMYSLVDDHLAHIVVDAVEHAEEEGR